MKIGIILFFAMFFIVSFIAVAVRLKQLYNKTSNEKQRLYNNKEYKIQKVFSGQNKRNEIVTEKDFKTYRDDVMALELP